MNSDQHKETDKHIEKLEKELKALKKNLIERKELLSPLSYLSYEFWWG